MKWANNRIIVTFILALFLITGLASCKKSGAQAAYGPSSNEMLADANQSAQYYWNKAQGSESPEREANLLLTANALLKARKVDEAGSILTQINSYKFTGTMRSFKNLVDARYQLAKGNPKMAIAKLNQVNTNDFAPSLQMEYRDLRAQSYAKAEQPIQSVAERVQLGELLPRSQMVELNNEIIWNTLQHVSLAQLKSANQTASNPTLKGWLELAVLERELNHANPSYASELARFENQYPNHPGQQLLPSNVSRASVDNLKPKHIALLLPLNGDVGNAAAAVRDGFLSAYYMDNANQGQKIKVTVLDTQNDTQVVSAYEKARSQGADMIVGPLTKEGVTQLASSASRETPILALNYVDKSLPSNVYQFGLAPEDEAKQAASQAWQDGHLNAIIIAQDGEWGDRISESFARQWKAQGGRVLSTTRFQSGESLNETVKAALNVNASESRAKQLISELNVPIDFETRRRQDVDMIFLVAKPQDARQITPLLAFYYAHNLPVYATSSVYSGNPAPGLDKDLNGVKFCDIPWNMDARPQSAQAKDAIAKLWPSQSNANQRLYALGVDAYQVIPQLPRLEQMPGFALSGATGKLYLNPNKQITRSLRCTEFVAGQPKRLDSSV